MLVLGDDGVLSLCTQMLEPSPCLSRWLFNGCGSRTSCTTSFWSIFLRDSTFQFLQGDLYVFSPVSISWSQLVVLCQLYWISLRVLLQASTSFAFPWRVGVAPRTHLPRAPLLVLKSDFLLLQRCSTFRNLLYVNRKKCTLTTHLSTFSFAKNYGVVSEGQILIISIIYTVYSLRVAGQLEPNPSWHWTKGHVDDVSNTR